MRQVRYTLASANYDDTPSSDEDDELSPTIRTEPVPGFLLKDLLSPKAEASNPPVLNEWIWGPFLWIPQSFGVARGNVSFPVFAFLLELFDIAKADLQKGVQALLARLPDPWIPEECRQDYPLAVDPLSNLWQSSRLYWDEDEGRWQDSKNDDGVQRAFQRQSLRHLSIALHILFWTSTRTFKILFTAQTTQIGLLWLSKVLQGVEDPLQLWLEGQMSEVAEDAFRGGSPDIYRLVILAVVKATLTVLHTALDVYVRKTQIEVDLAAGRIFQEKLMRLEYSIDIPTSEDPWVHAILANARQSGLSEGSPLHTMSRLTLSMVGVTAQSGLLFRKMLSLRKSQSTTYSITVVLLPIISAIVLGNGALFSSMGLEKKARGRKAASKYLPPNRPSTMRLSYAKEHRQLIDLADKARQEFVLFGLADWAHHELQSLVPDAVGSVWSTLAQETRAAFVFTQSFSASSMFILAALGGGTSSATLRHITTCSRGGQRLLASLGGVQRAIVALYNQLFDTASFWACIEAADTEHWVRRTGWYSPSQQGIDSLSYEGIRLPGGGVDIEAKGLSFCYPNSETPALKDINLKVKAGESLAIVGFNGGVPAGETLLKDSFDHHNGELLINGHSTKRIPAASFHKRTACLFQDFFKYPFSLRKNVGVGDVEAMDDEKKVRKAIRRGGAEVVYRKNRSSSKAAVPGPDSLMSSAPSPERMVYGPERKPALGLQLYWLFMIWSGLAYLQLLWAAFVDAILCFSGHRLPAALEPLGRGQRGLKRKSSRSLAPNLSGGQWQRITLSRTFMRREKADLIVYENRAIREDSSTLDGKQDDDLHIAPILDRADKIAFMEGGVGRLLQEMLMLCQTIVEFGSHDELMSLGGKYHELFTLQRKGFEESQV
ncbi:hypothetical protein P7C73_g5979, partial [Tremellales sp. Uapishka_1]